MAQSIPSDEALGSSATYIEYCPHDRLGPMASATLESKQLEFGASDHFSRRGFFKGWRMLPRYQELLSRCNRSFLFCRLEFSEQTDTMKTDKSAIDSSTNPKLSRHVRAFLNSREEL
jgi:hypothetical protein